MSSSSAKLDFILRLTDQVTSPLAKVKMGFSELAEKGRNNITQMGVGLAGVVGAGVAITQSLQPALEMNRALGEVKSLGVAEDALDALNRKALLFSVAYGENAKDFVASAYQVENAIKGLTGSQLATFTQASNVLAKATKSDAATMTAYVGTLYNLNKDQADAMGKGAWVEALAGQTALAVQLFRTSGAQIGEAFDAAGGLASNAGVSLAEQMAVLGTASSTMAAGDAGGAYREFFENVTGASEKLGMSFVDQQGKLLPMTDILDKLKGTFGDLSVEANSLALREAFGGNASRLLTTLIKDTDTLTNGMNQLGQVRGMAHAEQMARTMVDPWQQFTSAVMALRIAFGQKLMPLLSPLFEYLTGIGTTLLRWIDLFPNITRVVGFTVLAVFALTAGIALMSFTAALAKTAWLGMVTSFAIGKAIMLGLWGVLKLGTIATALFNAALWANPITWVVIGIAALVVAIAMAIVYWDEIVAAITATEAFQWISEQFAAVGAWFDAMGGWAGMAAAVWNSITSVFKGAINGVISLLNKIPGINIDASVGDLPEVPEVPAADLLPRMAQASEIVPGTTLLPETVSPPGNALLPEPHPALESQALHIQPSLGEVPGMPNLPNAGMHIQPTMGDLPGLSNLPDAPGMHIQPTIGAVPSMPALPSVPLMHIQPTLGDLPGLESASMALELAAAPSASLDENSQIPSLSPERPTAVPRGGLLTSIQNTQNQDKGTHVEKVEIHTGKAMSPLEMEQMLSMAVGG